MVADFDVIAGKTEDVVDSQGAGGQQVGLDGQTVAVPAGDLKNGLHAELFGQNQRRPKPPGAWKRPGYR